MPVKTSKTRDLALLSASAKKMATETSMSRTVLDLHCPHLWPKELLAYLDEHHDLFLGWETNQGQTCPQAFDKAIYVLRKVLQPYEILGWHCTRLTDAEAGEILCNGMQLPNAKILACRIDALVKTGQIKPSIARRLKAENQADRKYRAGSICFCFFPLRNAGEDGIGRFFRHWGGEALYVCHKGDPVTSSAISSIGTARIVEADVPIALLREHGNLEPSIYRRYLINRGASILPPDDYEDRIVHPLPAENVRRIISFPDQVFYYLTGCSEWRRPIPHYQPDPDCT